MFALISSQDHSVSTVSKAVADKQQAGTDSTTGTAGHNTGVTAQPSNPCKAAATQNPRGSSGAAQGVLHIPCLLEF